MQLNQLIVHVTTSVNGRSRIRAVLRLGTEHITLQTPGHVVSAEAIEQVVHGLRALAHYVNADFSTKRGPRPVKIKPTIPKEKVYTPPSNILEMDRRAEELLESLYAE